MPLSIQVAESMSCVFITFCCIKTYDKGRSRDRRRTKQYSDKADLWSIVVKVFLKNQQSFEDLFDNCKNREAIGSVGKNIPLLIERLGHTHFT
jgi:hypothetical protein